MKKQILAFLSHKNFHYLLIFLVSCVVAIPLIPLQLTNTHDGILHILRLIGTELSLHYTDFPHLVIPLFCNNFGYSINAFYSPINNAIMILPGIAQSPVYSIDNSKEEN